MLVIGLQVQLEVRSPCRVGGEELAQGMNIT